MTPVFTYDEGSILLKLIVSHIITDFFIQPDRWIADKKNRGWKSKYLLLHSLIAGVLALVLLQDKHDLKWALFISVSHYIIDVLKITIDRRIERAASLNETAKSKKYLSSFIADQIAHCVILVFVWLSVIHGFDKIKPADTLFSYRVLLRLAGYLIILNPTGYAIGIFTRRWLNELNMQDSLKDVGKWIGMMERIIILTLVLLNQFSSIGFLITAKSLLRLIDKPDISSGAIPPVFSSRKHTEYVLVGTFLSFSVALFVGILINFLLQVK